MGCRKFAERFSVGKTALSNIMKDIQNLRRDYEFFKGSYKKSRHGKYHVINASLTKKYKNTTSRLQHLDPSIIRKFKHKYRKMFVCYVVIRIDEGKTASQITEDAHILKTITWLQTTWKSVSTETIKRCLKNVSLTLEIYQS